MVADERVQMLKKRRKAYGLTQSKLALQAGVARTNLSGIESGKVILTDEMFDRLSTALDRLNPDSGMNIVIDYVRIRFLTTNAVHVIENILELKIGYMLHEDYGYFGYEEHYEYGNIFVMVSGDEEKGTLVEMKGQGSRQFEGVLEAQGRNWYDFFLSCVNEGCVFKRIDLAINDVNGILDIPELTEKCNREECVSLFRGFKSYRSGELVKKEEKLGMGYTLYIGSMRSDVYFCIYEKDYEQYVKYEIPIDEVPVKNRFEVRLMNDRAKHAVDELLTYRDGEDTVFGIINRYIRFVDRDERKSKEDWEVNDRWAWFLGENRRKIKLTSQPKPFNIYDTYTWLSHQVSRTWKMAKMIDEKNGTNIVDEMVMNAELSKRQEMIYKQCTAKLEDVIVENRK